MCSVAFLLKSTECKCVEIYILLDRYAGKWMDETESVGEIRKNFKKYSAKIIYKNSFKMLSFPAKLNS